HIGPDQAERQEIDDQYSPKRRNAEHREPGLKLSRLPWMKMTSRRWARPRQSPLSSRQIAGFPLNGVSLAPHNRHRGFILMNVAHRLRCKTRSAPILVLR